MTELTGQNAFVTGGGRGIGASIARELAAAGMDIVVSGRTAEQVESVAAELGGVALVGDVSKRDDVSRWFAEAGPIDRKNVESLGGQSRLVSSGVGPTLHARPAR